MAKTWYPVVNEDLCVNCNDCVNFCSHGVYEAGTTAATVVAPDECVEFCRGCSKICPTEAITYFGDQQNERSSNV